MCSSVKQEKGKLKQPAVFLQTKSSCLKLRIWGGPISTIICLWSAIKDFFFYITILGKCLLSTRVRAHERVLCPATASDQASSLSSIGQKIASGDFKSHPSPYSLKHHDHLCVCDDNIWYAGRNVLDQCNQWWFRLSHDWAFYSLGPFKHERKFVTLLLQLMKNWAIHLHVSSV